MTPKQKAIAIKRAFVGLLSDHVALPTDANGEFVALCEMIEGAIQQARNEALEEAARVAVIGKNLQNQHIEYGNGWFDGVGEYTQAIRALKDK